MVIPFLIFVLFWSGIGAAPSAAAEGREVGRPNVLLICIDAVRADHIGAYGASGGNSPHLDALARQGVVFEQAISVASWTKPAVTSLLTGLYPTQHRVVRAGRHRVDVLSQEVETVAETMAAAGYVTAAFVENDHLQRRSSQLDQGFGLYVDEAGVAPVLVHRFLSWLESERPKPFFVYLHIFDPHWPYAPDVFPKGGTLSPEQRLAVAHWALRTEHWWLLRDRVNSGRLRLEPAEVEVLEKLYDAEIFATDAVLGRMFRLLRDDAVLDDTLVIVTSDHGEGFLDHGKLDHGYGLYDELLRVPLIARFPRGEFAGTRVRAPVQPVDIRPTVLQAAGLPSGGTGAMSLRIAVENEKRGGRAFAFSEDDYGRTKVVSLRTAEEKYLRTVGPKSGPATTVGRVPADLAVGVRVQLEGIYAGGRVIGAQVKKVKAGDDDHEISAPIARIDAAGRRMGVLGYDVDLSRLGGTLSDDAGAFTLAALAPLDWVRLEGMADGQTIRARKIKRILDPLSQEIELEGNVAAFGAGADGEVWLELCGQRALVDPRARWEQFAEAAEPVGPAAEAASAAAEASSEELFDLASDPREQVDTSTARGKRVAEWRARGEAWLKTLEQGAARGASGVELDSQTRERLRALGYLE